MTAFPMWMLDPHLSVVFNTPYELVDVTVCILLTTCLVGMKRRNYFRRHEERVEFLSNSHRRHTRALDQVAYHSTSPSAAFGPAIRPDARNGPC
ncbi:hypothetical protein EVAR_11550_1 [Eumeta japonica]|uniref:Uncharacterized protein n=1 Tax=Eumeta variegata TaxID=151549 RepID=A0A4C1TYZ0_EUMVA|nr:hypothetical protein EVAR_11550_1 [Eumeta japonica]